MRIRCTEAGKTGCLSDGDRPDLSGPFVDVAENPPVDRAQVRQIVGGADRRFTEQDQRCVGDLPFGGGKFLRRFQPELVAQDSRNRVGVRIVGHLRLPVPGHGSAVQFGRADLAVHVSRDLAVMIRAERPRQFDLHGLGRGQGVV